MHAFFLLLLNLHLIHIEAPMKDNWLWLGALSLKGGTKMWKAKFHQPHLLSNRPV